MSGVHAELSPSSTHRWFWCPGSVRMSRGISDSESEPAAEGSYAHDIARRCLDNGSDAMSFIGRTSDCGRFTVDEEFAGHVQTYVDAVRCQARMVCPGAELFIETRVHMTGVRDDIFGQTDAALIAASFERIDVFDLKFGRGIWVDVDDNTQALCYALGIYLEHRDKLERTLKTIGLHIVQPRIDYKGPTWRTIDVPVMDLLKFATRLKEAAEATESPAAPLVPGESQCQFCPAKPTCPALYDKGLEVARHVFGATPVAAPNVDNVEPAELARLIELFPLVEGWMKSVRGRARTLLDEGVPVPGKKLVEKEGNRAWKNEANARAIIEVFGADPWADPKTVSPNVAEKRLTKLKVKPAQRAKLAALIKRPKSVIMVDDTDGRDAYLPLPAASVFPIEKNQ